MASPLRTASTCAANGSTLARRVSLNAVAKLGRSRLGLGRAPARPRPADRAPPRRRRALPALRRRARAAPRRSRRRSGACPRRSGRARTRSGRPGPARPRATPGIRAASTPTSLSATSACRISSATASSSGAIAGDGLERGVGLRGLLRRAGAVAVRDEQLGRLGRRGGEIGDVAQPLALRLQALLVAGPEPGGALDQLGELREVRLAVRRGLGQLVPAAARRRELLPRPCVLGAAAQLLLAGERVEDVQLVRGPREAPLLELARHGDQPLHERGQLLAGNAAAPRVGAGPAVGEDAPRGDEARLAFGLQLGDRLEIGVVEDPVG